MVNFNECLLYVCLLVILFNIVYIYILESLYFKKFPNSNLFLSYHSTLISIIATSTIQTFLIHKIFTSELSILIIASTVNILFQFYFSFYEVESKVKKYNELLNWNRNKLFRIALVNSNIASKLNLNQSEYYEQNSFLLKLPNCKLSVYKNSTDIIIKCYNNKYSNLQISKIGNISAEWEIMADYIKYGFVIDNLIELIEDEYKLSLINTENENILLGFLTKK